MSRHVQLLAPETPRASLQDSQLSILARRERQVIAHALDGLTAKETAQFMQLGLSTVLTYRYRAFAKLGVRSQRELVSALLARAVRRTGLQLIGAAISHSDLPERGNVLAQLCSPPCRPFSTKPPKVVGR